MENNITLIQFILDFILFILWLALMICVGLNVKKIGHLARRVIWKGVYYVDENFQILQIRPIRSEKEIIKKSEEIPNEIKRILLKNRTDIKEVKRKIVWVRWFKESEKEAYFSSLLFVDYKKCNEGVIILPSCTNTKEIRIFEWFEDAKKEAKRKIKEKKEGEEKAWRKRKREIEESRKRFLKKYNER